MKIYMCIVAVFAVFSCSAGNERVFTGSTPAGKTVRSFLGIPVSDSIDFIRWNIRLDVDHYELDCNYGIGKANTNGFIDGGQRQSLHGKVSVRDHYVFFENGNKTLGFIELNNNLLHLVDDNKTLLVGNDGWSYTLNAIGQLKARDLFVHPGPTELKDSMRYFGRTPCMIYGNVREGTTCYKLKWQFVLYADPAKKQTTTYYLRGTTNHHEGKTGTWAIVRGEQGKIFYELTASENNEKLYLVKLDDNTLAFSDQQGNLLVGNEDFSFTLNRQL